MDWRKDGLAEKRAELMKRQANPTTSGPTYADLAYGNEYQLRGKTWHVRWSFRSPNFTYAPADPTESAADRQHSKFSAWMKLPKEEVKTLERMIAKGNVRPVAENPAAYTVVAANPGYTTTAYAMPLYAAARRTAKTMPTTGANEGLKVYLGKLPAASRARQIAVLGSHPRNVEAWHEGWVAGQKAAEIARRNPDGTVRILPKLVYDWAAGLSGGRAENPGKPWTPKVTPTKTSLWEKREDGTGRWEKINTASMDYLQQLQKYSKRESRIQDKTPEMDGIKVVKGQFVRRNPEPDAADLYEEFHGRPSTEIIEVESLEHHHDYLAVLGELVEITVELLEGDHAGKLYQLTFNGCGVFLAASEDRTTLYIKGGDQSLPLDSMELGDPTLLKDSMVIGYMRQITYQTQKAFDDFATIDYYHKAGEETGQLPILLYAPSKAGSTPALSLSGGAYEIKDVGITN